MKGLQVSSLVAGWATLAILVAGALIPKPGTVAEELAGVVDYEAPVHPLYLDQICLPPTIVSPACSKPAPDRLVYDPQINEIPVESKSSTTFYAERPRDPDEGFYLGWLQYAVVAERQRLELGRDFMILEVLNNTGGTGIYGSIVVLEQFPPSDRLDPWLTIPGQDRCNDGFLDVLEATHEHIVYSAAATPFRLLNPTDDQVWLWRFSNVLGDSFDGNLPEALFGWHPYDDVTNAAWACAGEVIHRLDLYSMEHSILGVQIDRDDFLSKRQGSMQACINAWLAGTEHGLPPGDPTSWVALEDWARSLESLGAACAS